MKTTHTPGPWRVVPRGCDIWNIESMVTKEHIAKVCSSMQPDGRFDDDARLIAAAPDLLAALKDLIEAGEHQQRICCHEFVSECYKKAQAAIASAEQEQ